MHTLAPEVFDSRLPEGRRITRREDCLPSFSYHRYFPPCYPLQPSALSPSSPVLTGAAAFVCAQISFPRPALSFIISLPRKVVVVAAPLPSLPCTGKLPMSVSPRWAISHQHTMAAALPAMIAPSLALYHSGSHCCLGASGADIQSWNLVLLPSMYTSGVLCWSHSATPGPVCPSPGVV